MNSTQIALVEKLAAALPGLTDGQLHWVNRVIAVFAEPHKFELHDSDLFDLKVLADFGEAMRVHHSFSAEPFSKDKFEYVLVTVLKLSGLNRPEYPGDHLL